MELLESQNSNVIIGIEEGSIAEEVGIQTGDILISMNGEKIQDLMEYYYLAEENFLEVEIQTASGERILYEIEKDPDENLGILFTNKRMNQVQRCSNRCLFCFIDQLPSGMRPTLYIKDDDSRLSFLQGNFITMTNMKQEDLENMVRYRISPVNISVHTTNPELRKKMLGNQHAGDLLSKMSFLAKAQIEMNAQIVLIPETNDGEELKRTLTDLKNLYPHVKSVAVVPVGITKFRDNLPTLRGFSKEEALQVIESVEKLQKEFWEKLGSRFVFLSDEFYMMGEKPLPPAETYEEFIQLENGVGLMRKFKEEVELALEKLSFPLPSGKKRSVHLATGSSACAFMQEIAGMVMEKAKHVTITVHCIRNHFFGETITVSGLLTGQDLKNQLSHVHLEDGLFLPQVMFREGEEVLLDDETKESLESALSCKINIVPVDGKAFVEAVTGVPMVTAD